MSLSGLERARTGSVFEESISDVFATETMGDNYNIFDRLALGSQCASFPLLHDVGSGGTVSKLGETGGFLQMFGVVN